MNLNLKELDLDADNLSTLLDKLMDSFVWSESEEGGNYWSDVYSRVQRYYRLATTGEYQPFTPPNDNGY